MNDEAVDTGDRHIAEDPEAVSRRCDFMELQSIPS